MKKGENRKKKRACKKMNTSKGITLIALVITIIILLILAGVTIATLSGENGILSKATEAGNKTEEKNAEEEVKIAVMGSIGTNGELENEELKDNLNKIENISGVPEEITDSSYPLTVTVEGKYSCTINKNGSIEQGEVVSREGIKVGDYVNYTYDQKTEGYSLLSAQSGYTSDQTINQKSGMKWRVLNIHANGTVDLIGDVDSTDQTIYFQGALGYNNGVYLLNDICKELYSNSTLGITARSINIEDIESQMNETGIAARKAYVNSANVQYGKTKTYTGNYAYYPNLYAKEKGSGIDTVDVNTSGIEVSDNGYTSPTTETSSKASSLTVTQTFYYFSNTPANYFKDYNGSNSTVRNMLFNTEITYWLASRYAGSALTIADFGLYFVGSTTLSGKNMFISNASTSGYYYCIRPVLSLGTNIKIETCKGENSSVNMHEISK